MQPLILISNDDGWDSPGIRAAAEAVIDLGEVVLVAPRQQQTSMSRAIPKGEDVGRIEKFRNLIIEDREVAVYGVTGSPAQAVSHAILEILERKPDLCISGINYGENLGLGLANSGTIGAALEADSYDIPSIAVSIEASLEQQHSSDFGQMDWTVAKSVTKSLAKQVLAEGLPGDIAMLEVNVPHGAAPSTEVRVVRQSRQNYFVFKKPQARDLSKGFRLGVDIEIDHSTLERDSDIFGLIVDRVITVVPVTSSMTSSTPWTPKDL